MPTKRMRGYVQLATVVSPKVKAQLDKYAKGRGETLRTVIERALLREMRYPPPADVVPDFNPRSES